ncbi:protein NRT1/ PTR FAMILY 4.5-like isoform X2 [Iris pallida]|uniref:Protein NRT1/ PTR FAMILY 4.5-like isoform X2 n=1 Tax=Iris pallida TaxID=29817 RepID=A0AAX6HKE4_IRIPA|nr:protein NRT1/ PTR FAMILY 4.5-like isoform X2 [Iris pallida]
MASKGFVDWRGNPINKERHGGIRASLFILFMQMVLSLVYVSNSLNLVIYLVGTMHMGVAKTTTISTNSSGSTAAFALLGAFISDSYVSRFKTILIFVPLIILGFILLTIQAHNPSLQPPYCNPLGQVSACEQVSGSKLVLLYLGIYAFALGEGGQRACMASFGGDQFDSEDPDELRHQSSFFNWFTFGISLGGFVGVLLIVWLQTKKGWDYGFGISALVIFIGLVVLVSGFPFYRNQKPNGSPFTRMAQVFVAAFKKRDQIMHEAIELEQGREEKLDTEMLPRTKGLKFLDKASIDINGSSGPWSLCTTTQVEETKIIVRLIPLILSSTLNYIPFLMLLAFSVQQGTTMNTRLGKIHISPANLFLIPVIFQMVFLAAYDWLFVPLARRITGHSSGITPLQRVGAGCVSVIAASVVAAIVEKKRLNLVEENGLQNVPAGVPMSLFWLSWQFLILGITDVTTFVGLLEFYNTEVSSGMKSMGTAITWCVTGLASWLSTFLVKAVNKATRQGGKEGTGWIEGSTLNSSRLDRFYWLLSVLAVVGFLLHLFCAHMYVYRPQRTNNSAKGQVHQREGED